MAIKRIAGLKDTIYAVEIHLSNGQVETYGPYTNRATARGQRTAWVGDRADKFMGQYVRNPHVTDARVFVASGWEEV